MTRQIGSLPQSKADDAVLNLGLGQPSPSLLPLEAIREAAAQRFAEGADPLVLQYGAAAGYREFREALAALLSTQYRHPVGADELVVTAGTSSALAMVSQVFAEPGERVACGDPTYFLARGIFEGQRLVPLGIAVDAEGLDVDALEARLAAGGERVAFVYVIPSFHNPCGVTLDPVRAHRLVDLAEQHDLVVVADEPYPMLWFEEPPPCMMAYDEGRGRVLSLGSFSKILGPGLRLGWAHAAPTVLERFLGHGTFRSGGALNPLVSSLVQGCIDSGFLAEHIGRLRRELGQRARVLVDAVRHHLPEAEVAAATGGYFIWLRLAGLDATARLEACRREHGVGYTPGPRCAVERDLSDRLRLSFSFYAEGELVAAVERLGKALRG